MSISKANSAKTRKAAAWLLLACGLFLVLPALGQEFLDQVDDHLHYRSPSGALSVNLSGLLDLEGYYIDQRPPALIYEDESFFNYRLSFFLDAKLGTHFYAFLQARLDHGFDPGAEDFDARLDEYFLRYTPWNDNRLNLQFGKFATVVGSWVKRHYSWDNPLINAPLPYENMTPISVEFVPRSRSSFLIRRFFPDFKQTWVPIIWGPAYTTGGSVFGTLGKFDYAAEVKNAAISSFPYSWDLDENFWRYPTASGRIGFRPSPAWNHGISLSSGPYMSTEAIDQLPAGKKLGDYNQITLGADSSYAWRRFQLWAELFLSRFEVPNVGNADMLGYYLEAKYKITSGLYAAARWNQEFYARIPDNSGVEQPWGADMYRIDLALGYRFTRHLQTKLQYSFGHRQAPLQQGEQLVAAQVTVAF